MHHQDQSHSAHLGNRPAKGARIVDSQAGLEAQGTRAGAVDFLGLDGLEIAPLASAPASIDTAVDTAVQHELQDDLEAVLGTQAEAGPLRSDRARLLQPDASVASPSALAPKLGAYARPTTAATSTAGRRYALAAGLLVVAVAGGTALWPWRGPAAPVAEPTVVAPARGAAARSASPLEPASAPLRQENLTEPAREVAPWSAPDVAAAQDQAAQAQRADPSAERVAAVPATPTAATSALEPAPNEVAAPVVEQAAPAQAEPSLARPASESPVAGEPSSSSMPLVAPVAPHAALAARLQLERRFATRHGRSPLATASVWTRAAWPAGDGSTLVILPLVAEAPRLVRDFAPAEPSVPGGPRRVAPEAFGHVHQGDYIPLDAMRGATRLLTPKVGEVRVLLRSGETFEGRLHALGEGGAWLDTDLGRMLLHASQVRGIEPLAGKAADGGTSNPGSDQSPRVRVVCAGGVFTGALISRQGDEVVLATDEGSRIKLKALKVESVSREGTQLRGRLPSKPKD